jgi:putative transposase
MLGFKNFFSAKRTIAGIESIRMIQKRPIDGFDEKQSTYQHFQLLMAK